MPNDFDFLRAASRFNSRPTGMPYIDDSSINDLFRQVAPMVSSMKNDDLYRQKELLQFRESLNNAPRNQALTRDMITRGPNAIKNHVTVYAPPTQTQAKFAREEAEARDEKFRMGQLAAQQKGSLNQALAVGAQRSEADMARLAAELNATKENSAAERTSREKIATTNRTAASEERAAQREFTAEQNMNKGWEVANVPDPNDPTKTIAVRMNKSTGQVEPITHDGKNVGNLMRPGTKPTTVQGMPSAAFGNIRDKTQGALDEIRDILNDDDTLTPEGKAATGKSALFARIPFTAGRAGSNSINRIKSQSVLNLIGEMKAQSKTGATGFGNMSNKDLSVLEDAANKLDTYTREEDFVKELKRIRGMLRKIMEDPDTTQPEPDRPGTVSTGKKPRLDPAEMYNKYSKYGGQ